MARWKRSRVRAFVLSFAAVGVACASAAPPPPSAAAPNADAKGTLLIVGGGPIPDALLERFVTLAGGAGRARIVIYPMASEYPDAGLELAGDFRKLGAEAERIVLSRAEADTESAAQRLDSATGIWFGGGDQSRLTRGPRGHPRRGGDPAPVSRRRRRRRHLRGRGRHVDADDHRRRAPPGRRPAARKGLERCVHDDRPR